MEIIRVKDAAQGGKKAFELIQEGMANGAKVLGLATGSTPETLYAEMTASEVDFSEMTSVNLDEYVGLGGEDEQSYRYFMNAWVSVKTDISASTNLVHLLKERPQSLI